MHEPSACARRTCEVAGFAAACTACHKGFIGQEARKEKFEARLASSQIAGWQHSETGGGKSSVARRRIEQCEDLVTTI
jgi:hypothetical protein